MSKAWIPVALVLGGVALYLYWRRSQQPQAPGRRVVYVPSNIVPGMTPVPVPMPVPQPGVPVPVPMPVPQPGVPVGLEAISLARCGPGKTLIRNASTNSLLCLRYSGEIAKRCSGASRCPPGSYRFPMSCDCITEQQALSWPIIHAA